MSFEAEKSVNGMTFIKGVTPLLNLEMMIQDKFFAVGISVPQRRIFSFCPLTTPSAVTRKEAFQKAKAAALEIANICQTQINIEEKEASEG